MAIRTVSRETWERSRGGKATGDVSREAARDDLAGFLINHLLLPTAKWRQRFWEPVWVACWQNFRGELTDRLWHRSEANAEEGRSEISVGVTKRKVRAAVNRARDIAFPAEERPWMLKPTPVSQGLRKKHVDKLLGLPGMDALVLNGLADLEGGTARAKLEAAIAEEVEIEAYAGLDRATKEVADIWDEGSFADVFKDSLLLSAIYGTSVIKGPFEVEVPVVSFSSGKRKVTYRASLDAVQLDLFHYLVDQWATGTGPKKARWEAYHDLLTESEIRDIAQTWEWDDAELTRALEAVRPPNQRLTMEGDKQTRDEATPAGEADGSQKPGYEYVEFYGRVPVQYADAFEDWPEGAPDEDHMEDSLQVEVIVQLVNGMCPHAVVNDTEPARRPFHVMPWAEIPGSPYGCGIGEDLLDLHELTDSAYRLYVDNKGLVGNPPVGIDATKIADGYEDSIEMELGALWYFNTKPSDAMQAVQVPDVTASLKDLVEVLENLSDEQSGVNRYTSGDPSRSLNQTARGISILTSRADLVIRGALDNLDRHHIQCIVQDVYHWVRENRNLPLETDYDVVASGSTSLMAREQQIQQLIQFASVFGPTMAPAEMAFVKRKTYKLMGFDDVDRLFPEPSGAGALAGAGGPAGAALAGPGGMALPPGIQGAGGAPGPTGAPGGGGMGAGGSVVRPPAAQPAA
jgi:hypothetical protein